MIFPPINLLMQNTDALRREGKWLDALNGYQAILKFRPDDATVAHNLALCHLALGNSVLAQLESLRALQLKPTQWQSGLIQAKSLVANGQKTQGLALLEQLVRTHPLRAELVIDLAKLLMQHGGDAARACDLVRPFLMNAHHRDAELVLLTAQLYDRDVDVDAQTLSQHICAFAQTHLQLPMPMSMPMVEQICVSESLHNQPFNESKLHESKRLKVGLLSPQFCVSPVYFFTFSVLQLMSKDVDFIFFNRGTKSDWATRAFCSIAHDWVDVSLCSSMQLATLLASHGLDVLMDLGGWMDPVGLQALSVKPAKKLFKWVGGQSATTGLRCFDGYLTDLHQTPKGFERFFSEPLIRLQSGYVTYTPPPYLPEPVENLGSGVNLGVIANPAKLSRAFLADLANMLAMWRSESVSGFREVQLHLVDKRYAQENIRRRILTALPGVDVNFVTPVDHLAYLNAVRGLDATLDTWPYSGGLTTIEALAVGVPSFTRAGELFCERHTVSHCFYAGLKLGNCGVDKLKALDFANTQGKSLLSNWSPRSDHDALARELLFCLHVI